MKENKIVKEIPTVVDLFSGCGGLSYGLEKAGFKIILGIDSWKDALSTFEWNHKDSKILQANISEITGKDIKRYTKNKKVNLIVGGPPCQGFSLSGPRNFYDKRNRLYLDFIRLVSELEPDGFLIENVPGLASLFKGQVKDKIIEEFTKLGYKVSSKILNASDYGVPQNRRRIFFVGLKSGQEFAFPEPTHFEFKNTQYLFPVGEKKVTVWEAISDLPTEQINSKNYNTYSHEPSNYYQKKMREDSSNKIINHEFTKHSEQTKMIVSNVPEGSNYKSLPESLKSARNFHVAWTRLHRQKPSPTIDTGHRHHFHPVENRVPTVREAARIQSFPDNFIFLSNKTSQYKQVGNAVPPLLAEVLGKELIKYF